MNPNKTTIILTVLVVAGAAYWYFFTGTGNDQPLTATAASSNQAQMQFQSLVSILQPITFSTTIFDDSRFAALVDLTTPIEPETSGRLDPFAPVSSAAPIIIAPVKKTTGR